MSQTLRLRLDYLLLCWFQQPAYSLRLVPLFQQRGQSREEFLLLIVHAATVQLMGFRVLANGQAIHEPLPEIALVCNQHRFQDIVQKLQALFQFGEVTFSDGNESLFLYAEAIFVPVEVVVLTEIFCVCVVGKRLLIISGVIRFIQLPFFRLRTGPRKPSSSSRSMASPEIFILSIRLYLAFRSPFTSIKAQKDFLLEV